MKLRYTILLLIAIAGALTANASRSIANHTPQNSSEPRFQEYPAEVYAGKAGLLNSRSHKLARVYRARLREALRQGGINFAGHYTFASIGCGAGCSINAIVDATNGKAFFPEPLNGWAPVVATFDREPDYAETTRADSRLLRLVGRPTIGNPKDGRHGASGIYFYEWKNDELRLIKVMKAGPSPHPDPRYP